MSYSVGSKTFKDLKAYSKQLIEALPIDQVAAITFASKSYVAFPFISKQDAVANIQTKVNYKGGGTNLGQAIQKVLSILEDQKFVAQVLILCICAQHSTLVLHGCDFFLSLSVFFCLRLRAKYSNSDNFVVILTVRF